MSSKILATGSSLLKILLFLSHHIFEIVRIASERVPFDTMFERNQMLVT
jgi:hypothetical protein